MEKRIRIGTLAPNFTELDSFGKTVKLKRAHASNYVLLVFLRYAGCPLCNLALERLRLEYNLLKKNDCEIIVVIDSNSEKIQKNIHARHKQNMPFHIIPDPQRKLYSLYSVMPQPAGVIHLITNLPYWLKAVTEGYGQKEVDGSFFIVPAFFLINQKGNIVEMNYSANFYDDETFTPLYEHLTFGV